MSNSTITGPDVQRGFHPEARYEFQVHFDPPGHETLTYRMSFGESDSEGRQAPQLHALTGEAAREDTAAGTFVLEGRTGEPASRGDTRIWAGRIADPFYINLSLLSIVYSAVQNGTAADSHRLPAQPRPSTLDRRHERALSVPGRRVYSCSRVRH